MKTLLLSPHFRGKRVRGVSRQRSDLTKGLRQLIKDQGSVFRLENKSWLDFGRNGRIVVYGYDSRPNDILVRWYRTDQSVSLQVVPGRIKSKGPHSWVVRAFDLSQRPPSEVIVAFRFDSETAADSFAHHFETVSRRLGLWMDASPATAAVTEGPSSSVAIPGAADTSTPPSTWVCQVCTFENEAPSVACQICSAEREPEHSSPAATAMAALSIGSPMPSTLLPRRAQWKCMVCTLENDGGSLRCEACGTPRSTSGFAPQRTRHAGSIAEAPPSAGPSSTSALMVTPGGGSGPTSSSSSSVSPSAASEGGRLSSVSIGSVFESMAGPGSVEGSGPSFDRAGKVASTADDFSRAAQDIAFYNASAGQVFGTLRSIARKLMKDDIKYRSLDTTNPRVEERLLGFAGVLDFLHLLGFESDAMGLRLVCKEKPSEAVVRSAIAVLQEFEDKHLALEALQRGEAPMDEPGGSPRQPSMVASASVASVAAGAAAKEDGQKTDDLTLRQIILWCTRPNSRDSDTMQTLLMCHLEFSSSLTLLTELRNAFFLQLPEDLQSASEAEILKFREKHLKPTQLKVVKYLRDWMKQYWSDFRADGMTDALASFIADLRAYAGSHEALKWVDKLAGMVESEAVKLESKSKKEEAARAAEAALLEVESSSSKRRGKVNLQKLSAEELAENITLMDFDIFAEISPRECLGQAWKKGDGKERAPHILALIDRFNQLTVWIQLSIIKSKGLRERSKQMKKVIKMGQVFRELSNYNALCAVYSALNSASIHRLKQAWKRVPVKQQRHLEEIRTIFSRDKNQRNLRELYRSAVAPCIPHIGLFLQDLVFIDDGNEDERKEENFADRSMINFSKSVRTAERVKNIAMYQVQPYSKLRRRTDVITQLESEFAKCSEVSEDNLWHMSTQVKRRDESDAQSYFA